MSLETSTTSRGACNLRKASTTPRIWLSALPWGRLLGKETSRWLVWKNKRPPTSLCPVLLSAKPTAMSAPGWAAKLSRLRLVWRALRATSVMPFLCPSSSSRTIMGRKTSCSSKRNKHMGSCISTLVSSTNSLAGPLGAFFLGLGSTLGVCEPLSAVLLMGLGSDFSRYRTTFGPGSGARVFNGGSERLAFGGRCSDHSEVEVVATDVSRASVRSRAARLPGGGGNGMVYGFGRDGEGGFRSEKAAR